MRIPPLVEPIDRLSSAEAQRTSRQRRLAQLGEVGQHRLANARVLVLGAGGLGSPALLYLAAAGVGTIGIVDDDDVEFSNLQRQIVHGSADVGRPKVVSAAESVRAVAPEASVILHQNRLDSDNAATIIAGYDVVLDGTDNFPTRFLVNDVCARLGLPLVWASVLRFDAQLSVFWANPPAMGVRGVNLRDLFPIPPADGEVPSCAEAGVLGALCGQVGSLMATEAIKLITGIGTPLIGRILVIDALSGRFTEVPLVGSGSYVPADTEVAGGAKQLGGTDHADHAPRPSTHLDPSTPPRFVAPPTLSTLSTADVIARLAAREAGTDTFVIVDVREASENAESALPGAVLLPLGDILSGARRADLPRDVPLILHCHTGARAERAARTLLADGFADVTVLTGGIVAWDDAVADGAAPGAGTRWATASQKSAPVAG